MPAKKKVDLAAQYAEQVEIGRISYEAYLEDQMGHLHNRFVAFIAESRLPLPQVLLVLKILETETMEQAAKKYLGA